MGNTPFASHGINQSVITGTGNGRLVPAERNIEIFDDFVHSSYPTLAATPAAEGAWSATMTTGGAIVPLAGTGGWITLDSDGTDDDEILLHSDTTFFTPVLGKKFRFEIRGNATRTDGSFFFGFGAVVGTLGDANATILAANHVGFNIPEVASVSFANGNVTTQVTTDTTIDHVATTNAVYTFEYDGDDTIRAWIDDTLRVTHRNVRVSATPTLPNLGLKVLVGQRNGSGASCDFDIDYIYAYVEM